MSFRSGKSRVSVCIFMAAIILIVCRAESSENLSAYQVLEEYGFPVGLLPDNVERYTLNSTDGSFEVYLNGSCSFEVKSRYRLKYKSKITGRISMDCLKDLEGISVKVLFFWLSINEVIVEGDELEFYVGIASSTFSVSNFDVSPQCGCGFDCANGSAAPALIAQS